MNNASHFTDTIYL